MEKILNAVIKELLGDISVVNLLTVYVFSFLGAVFHWIVDTKNGIKNSKRSPNSFSFSYWWKNNFIAKIQSLILAIIAIFIAFRLKDFSIFSDMYIYTAAFIIGGSIDWVTKQIADKFKK